MEGIDTTSSSGDQQAFVVVDGGTLHEDMVTIRFIYALAAGEEAAQDLALEMLSLDDLDGDGLSLDEGDCDDRSRHLRRRHRDHRWSRQRL